MRDILLFESHSSAGNQWDQEWFGFSPTTWILSPSPAVPKSNLIIMSFFHGALHGVVVASHSRMWLPAPQLLWAGMLWEEETMASSWAEDSASSKFYKILPILSQFWSCLGHFLEESSWIFVWKATWGLLWGSGKLKKGAKRLVEEEENKQPPPHLLPCFWTGSFNKG